MFPDYLIQPMQMNELTLQCCSCLSWEYKSYNIFILRIVFAGYYDGFYIDNFSLYMFTN